MKLVKILILWQITYLQINAITDNVAGLKCEFTQKENYSRIEFARISFKCATKEFMPNEEGVVEVNINVRGASLQDNLVVTVYKTDSGDAVIRRELFVSNTDLFHGSKHLELKITKPNINYYLELAGYASRNTTIQVQSIRYLSLKFVKDIVKNAVSIISKAKHDNKIDDYNNIYSKMLVPQGAPESSKTDSEATADFTTSETGTTEELNTLVEENTGSFISHPLTITLIFITSLILLIIIIMCGLYYLWPKKRNVPSNDNDTNVSTLETITRV